MRHNSTKMLAAICAVTLSALACDHQPSGPSGEVGSASLNSVIHATQAIPQPGTYALGITEVRDAQLVIPSTVRSTCPIPTIIMLHGAGGTPNQIATVISAAAEVGAAVIVPYSRAITWEIAVQTFGQDTRNIDKAIAAADQRFCIDASHLALAGFSDGASFALSLGVANGNLFSHVIAFSPGFILDPGHRGKARFYVSHGTSDSVLPFNYTQNQLVPYLQNYGYNVTFSPFAGGHTVDSEIAGEALLWLRG